MKCEHCTDGKVILFTSADDCTHCNGTGQQASDVVPDLGVGKSFCPEHWNAEALRIMNESMVGNVVNFFHTTNWKPEDTKQTEDRMHRVGRPYPPGDKPQFVKLDTTWGLKDQS